MSIQVTPWAEPWGTFEPKHLHTLSTADAPPAGHAVYWSPLLERNTSDHAVNSLLDVATQAGGMGYIRIRWGYSRTDIARNEIIRTFIKESKDEQDWLVMLDNDHLMPPDIIQRLVRWGDDKGVVGALAFRRGVPFFPCFFVADENDQKHIVIDWEPGLHQCYLVGSGAVAIKRWVFTQLDDAGYEYPYFRYTYPPGDAVLPSEDIYFGDTCAKAGIQHWVDCTFDIPHLTSTTVDSTSWHDFVKAHPNMMQTGTGWDKAMQGEWVEEQPESTGGDGTPTQL